MSSDFGQLGMDLEEEGKPLFPYPDHLVPYDFSFNKIFDARERKKELHLEVEFLVISPVEFSVHISKLDSHFTDIVKENKNLKYHKDNKDPNVYQISLKHYFYVHSKVKEHMYMTVNYNSLNRDFIRALINNLNQNDNILTFIQNRKSRKSIIESLEFDPKFGKSIKMMSEYQMIDDLEENQMIAFYMCVVRNGKSILADRTGKSMTALTIMTYFRNDWPLVIVCDKKRKKYWNNVLTNRYQCSRLFRISVINTVTDIYVYPNPFHDIMIIDYELYYQVKDTVSFRNLNIKAFILEDQCRGNSSHSRPWKGLSDCTDNLRKANRIIFISAKPFDSNYKRLWPLLTILDPKTFEDFGNFESRYCDPEHMRRQQVIKEFQILLRSTFFICNNSFE